MATSSFSKDFAVSKRGAVERLEKGVRSIEPLNTNSKNVIAYMRKREEKLLNMLCGTNVL